MTINSVLKPQSLFRVYFCFLFVETMGFFDFSKHLMITKLAIIVFYFVFSILVVAYPIPGLSDED
ncbi:MAG: hypothetical protein AAF202_02975 [Pseudomonadota bacterium]